MVDNNNQFGAEAGLDALAARLAQRGEQAEQGLGGRAQTFVDGLSRQRGRMWRPGTGSYALGARELAVEVGLRYLPLAAEAEFLPVGDYWERDLYPMQWQRWVNADLLRLFEEEEAELLAQAWQEAKAAPAQARRPARPAKAAAAPRPTALQRRASRVASLARRVDKITGGLGAPLERAVRLRTLQLTPADVAERVHVAAEAPTPARRREVEQRLAAEQATTERRAARAGAPAAAGEILGPPIAGETLRRIVERARSPYPTGVGRAASFTGMLAARPPERAAQPAAGPTPRPSPALVAEMGEAAATLSLPAARRAMAAAPAVAGTPWLPGGVGIWLDEVGIDRKVLPALSSGLSELSTQGARVARSVALVLDPERPQARLLQTLESRTSGQRAGIAPALEGWREWAATQRPSQLASRLGGSGELLRGLALEEPAAAPAADAAPAGAARPGRPAAAAQTGPAAAPPAKGRRPARAAAPPAAPAPTVAPAARAAASQLIQAALAGARPLAARVAGAVMARADSVRLAGLTSYDANPARPGSDTKLALTADGVKRTQGSAAVLVTQPTGPALPAAATAALRAGTPISRIAASPASIAAVVREAALGAAPGAVAGVTPPAAPQLGRPAPVLGRIAVAPLAQRQPQLSLSLSQIAPAARLDAVTGQPRPARPVAAERSWQLFTPAKALSLSLLLGGSEAASAAEGGGSHEARSEQALRLGLALTEGRRALADLQQERGVAAAAERRATAFGPLQLEPVGGGIRAMRLPAVGMGSLVQIFQEEPSPLERIAAREASSVQGFVAEPAQAAPWRTTQPAVARALAAARPASPAGTPPLVPAALRAEAAAQSRPTSPLATMRALQPEVGPRAIAALSAAVSTLPTALRPISQVLTSLPANQRRAVAAGEMVELPTEVQLPAAVMQALRQAPAGRPGVAPLRVVGLLESPARIVGEPAQRSMARAFEASRVLLVSLPESGPAREVEGAAREVGRPIAATVTRAAILRQAIERRAIQAAEAAPRGPTARRPAAPAAARAAAAALETGLPPARRPAPGPAARAAEPAAAPTLAAEVMRRAMPAAVHALSGAIVQRLVAEGRLLPEVAAWVEQGGSWAQAVQRRELGVLAPAASLLGLRGVIGEPVAGGVGAPMAGLERTLAEREAWAAPRAMRSMVAQASFAPTLVTLSDEVAQAAPLVTAAARSGLVPLATLESLTGEPSARAAARPVARQARPIVTAALAAAAAAASRGIAAPTAAAVSATVPGGMAAPGAPAVPGVAGAWRTLMARVPYGGALLSLGPAAAGLLQTGAAAGVPAVWASGLLQRTEGFAQLSLGGLEGEGRPIRGMSFGRAELVSLPAEVREAIDAGSAGRAAVASVVSQVAAARDRAVQRVAQGLGRPLTAQPAKVSSVAEAAHRAIAQRAAFSGVTGPAALLVTPTVARPMAVAGVPSAAGRPQVVEARAAVRAGAPAATPTVAGPRPTVRPLAGGRVRAGGEAVARRPLATVQREAVAELRRAGMTAQTLQRLTGWMPSSVRPLQALGGVTEGGLAPALVRQVMDLPSAEGSALGATLAGAGGLTRSLVREALGEIPMRASSGVEVGTLAGLPSFELPPVVIGKQRPERPYGLGLRTEQARPVVSPESAVAAEPAVTAGVSRRVITPVRRGLAARPVAPAGTRPSAAEAPRAYESWRSLVSLAAQMFGTLSGKPAPRGEQGHYPATNLRWFEAELRTLVAAGEAAKYERGMPQTLTPKGAEGTRRLLAYLDGEAPAEPASRPRSAPPTSGPAGPVVVPEQPREMKTSRRRLQTRSLATRPPKEEDQVQGTALAGPREYVAPWVGAGSTPGFSVQPLLSVSGGSGETLSPAAPGRSRPGGGGDENIEELADEVYDIIKFRLDIEQQRRGG